MLLFNDVLGEGKPKMEKYPKNLAEESADSIRIPGAGIIRNPTFFCKIGRHPDSLK